MPTATQVQSKPKQLSTALSPDDRALLAEHLEPIKLGLGERLREPGQPQPYCPIQGGDGV